MSRFVRLLMISILVLGMPLGAVQAAKLAAGDNHTCAITPAGGVMCWGYNHEGKLGNGSINPSSIPVPVSGLSSGVTAISVGSNHTCALLQSGQMRCWGRNAEGQLGTGNTNSQLTPQPVAGLPNPVTNPIVAIATGGNFTCALDSTGKVWCWGENTSGQLGNGQTSSNPTPVPQAVTSLDDASPAQSATAIATGYGHACALRESGVPVCWGSNLSGELGKGDINGASTPQTIKTDGDLAGFSIFTHIAAGGSHTCMVADILINSSGGAVFCWGRNNEGQLGNNSTSSRSLTPVLVDNLSNIAELALGTYHTCARRLVSAFGSVSCWGLNDQGQLGDGTVNDRLVPVTSGFGTGNFGLAAGGHHTCAMKIDGTVQCTGANDGGQLGSGARHDSTTPLKIPGLSGAIALSVGDGHVCAVLSVDISAFMQCWGRNTRGQLGDGTLNSRATPAPVLDLTGAASPIISAGYQHTCAVTGNGLLQCWGNGGIGQLGISNDDAPTEQTTPALVDDSELDAPPARLAGGSLHTCAAIYQGSGGINKMLCWGSNKWYGQLGVGDENLDESYVPMVTIGPQSALAIDTGELHTCMVAGAQGVSTRQVWCWGYNGYSQLGVSGPSRYSPINVNEENANLPTNWSDVATGGDHSCALSSTQGIWCWGHNIDGQLGHDYYFSPSLPNLAQAHLPIAGGQEVVAGNNHTCARYTNGWSCWGNNEYGQLGNSTYTSTDSNDPVLHSTLPDNSKVARIDAGGNTTCAIDSNGHVWCWGDGYWGQLGDEGRAGFATNPVSVAAFPPGTNTLPVANAQTVYTAQGQALSITLTGSDADNDTLAFSLVNGSAPSHGSLSAIDANTHTVTYTPDPGYTGDDSFQFVVNDGTVDSAPATVDVTVTAFAIFKNGFEEP